jgi:UDP-glucose 4-epimerase
VTARILVVGRGFVGRALAEALGPGEARLVSHGACREPGLLRGVATVVFAGRDPALGTAGWRIEDDLEPALARQAAQAHASFVSLGTRKVYAPSANPLAETDRIGPTDLYGRQKLALEHALTDVLGPRLTRLRLANVFGYERRPGRATFLSQILAGLDRRDEVRFDVSPFVRRDFLPIDLCAAWLAQVARRPPGGILNLGSGVALPVGRLALWLIEGFGRGRLVVESPEERDSFVLDTSNLKAFLGGAGCGPDDLRARCLDIGRRLRAEIERR